MPFSLSEAPQIQIFFRQLLRLSLQSRRHLPLWCRHEPVPDRHRQVFDRPAQATLPRCVQTWLDIYQLLIRGLYWGLHLHRRCNNVQWGQVGVAVARRKGVLQGVLSRNWFFFHYCIHNSHSDRMNDSVGYGFFTSLLVLSHDSRQMGNGGLISWKNLNHCLVALTKEWMKLELNWWTGESIQRKWFSNFFSSRKPNTCSCWWMMVNWTFCTKRIYQNK